MDLCSPWRKLVDCMRGPPEVCFASEENFMDFATIATLRKYLSIKHSLPGRIRIKFALGIMKDPEALALAQSPPEMPDAVTETKLNIFSRTLLIEYDAEQVPSALLEELITTDDDDRAAEIVEELHNSLFA